jgi:hypothetical protein
VFVGVFTGQLLGYVWLVLAGLSGIVGFLLLVVIMVVAGE